MRLVNTLVDLWILARRRFPPPPVPPWDPLYARPLPELAARAEDGDAQAAYVLGDIHDQGYNGVIPDHARALRWYRLAEEGEQPNALNNIGSMYEHGQGLPRSLEMARRYYERAVAGGNPTAMNNLGRFILKGEGGCPRDPRKAVALLRRGAEAGDADAMLCLASLSAKGEGVRASRLRALAWNRRVAALGDPRGFYNLAVAYEAGRGVLMRPRLAADLYRRAADLGHAESAYWLARLYHDGEKLPRDLPRAYRFFRHAEELGHAGAPDWAERLRETYPEVEG